MSLRSTSNCDVVAGACPRSRFKTVSTALLDRFFLAEARLHPFAFVCACVRVQRLAPLFLSLCGSPSRVASPHDCARLVRTSKKTTRSGSRTRKYSELARYVGIFYERISCVTRDISKFHRLLGLYTCYCDCIGEV